MDTVAAQPVVTPGRAANPAADRRPLRVALVGCGAVARSNLLPVLAGHDGVRLTALVDRDRSRARELADAYQVSQVLTDLDALGTDTVDAVVLATPPAHHAPATIALAGCGLHVFVEKPMATSLAGAEAMVAAADRAGITLGVGLYRRFLPSVRLLKHLVETGEYGAPLAIDVEEGGPYGWELATLAVLTREHGGGGVLIDLGSHLVDELLFVMAGQASLDSCRDNARGGIETDCLVHFDVATARGRVPARMELSRTRELRNSIRIECEDATLELRRPDFTQVLVHRRATGAHGSPETTPVRLTASWADAGEFAGYQAFRDQIDDWLDGIIRGREPLLSGRSVLPVVELIEQCYQRRTDLPEPWTDEGLHVPRVVARDFSPASPDAADRNQADLKIRPAAAAPRPARHRILVTGAGGFLGGRAVEVLRERHGWEVVPLVRSPRSAARLARWPGEIVVGDVCSADDMARALAGCDAVVHCAVGTVWPPEAARRVTVEGTRTVAEAALGAGISRFVHISTLFVHDRGGDGGLDETTPLEPPAADDYGQAKLAAERALEAVARRGLSTVVLRPVRIYGPFSKTFTIRPLEAIARGRFAIAGSAEVPANMVYVDNVVEAIARAVEAPASASGAAFLIGDADQVSLGEFYEYFARHAGQVVGSAPLPVHVEMPKAGLAGRWMAGVKSIATSPELRGLVRKIIFTDPVGRIPRRLWERSPAFQQSMLRRFGADAAVVYRPAPAEAGERLVYDGEPGRVVTTKAERELGFVAPVRRERAMALTLAWARYARLLP